MREWRLERALVMLRRRAEKDGDGGHESRRRALQRSIEEFERELDTVRRRLGRHTPPR